MPDAVTEQNTLALIPFVATGSTREADAWLARLSPSEMESPRIIDVRKRWAILKGDYAGWKRLDAIQPYVDVDAVAHWQQALTAATVMAAQGDLAGARGRLAGFPTEVKSTLQIEPANYRLWVGLSAMEALLGQNEEALRDARKAVEVMPETLEADLGLLARRNLAVVYAWTGDKDAAIAELARIIRTPSMLLGVNVHLMRVDPDWAPLRGDPRFEALLNDPKNNAPLF